MIDIDLISVEEESINISVSSSSPNILQIGIPGPPGPSSTWATIPGSPVDNTVLVNLLGQKEDVGVAQSLINNHSLNIAAHPLASTTSAGFMAAGDKIKLNDTYTKAQVDSAIANASGGGNGGGATVSDATTSTKGIIQLAGDLAGTASSPTVPGLTTKANTADVYNKTQTDSALSGKANTVHSHSGSDITSGTVDITRLPVAANGVSSASSLTRADDLRLSDARSPLSHVHIISEVTGLQTALDGKAIASNTYTKSEVDNLISSSGGGGSSGTTSIATQTTNGLMSSVDKTKLDGIATGATANSTDTYLLSRVNHTGTQGIATITGLQTALDGKVDDSELNNYYTKTQADTLLGAKADSAHTHTFASLTGKPTTLVGYGITDAAPASHTHSGADITSGTVDIARLPVAATGVVSNTSLVRADDARLSDARSPLAHTHTAANITSGVFDIAQIPVANDGVSNTTSVVRADDTRLSNSRTPTAHSHSAADITTGTLDLTRLSIAASGVSSTTALVRADDSRLSDARAPLAHTHPWSNITATPTTLTGYGITDAASISHTHSGADITSGTVSINRLPVATSGISSATQLVRADDSRLSDSRTPTAHSHTATDITGVFNISQIPVANDGVSNATTVVRADDSRLSNARTPTAHTHSTADITSGTFDLARLPVAATGVSSATSLVRADDSRLSDARTPTAHTHAWSSITATPTTLAGYGITDAAPASHTHSSANITDFAEAVDDRVGAFLVAGANITLSYDDAANSLTINSTASGSGGGAINLDGLTDVTLTSPANNQILQYSSATAQWVNAAPSFVDLSTNQTIAGNKLFSSKVAIGSTNTPNAAAQISGGLAITSSTSAVTDPGAGNISVSGNITTTGNLLVSTLDGINRLQFNTTTTGNGGPLVNIDGISSTANVTSGLRFFRNTNTGTAAEPAFFSVCVGDGTANEAHRFSSKGNSYFAATSGTFMGIGTLTPSNAGVGPKLHVAGGVAITSATAAQADPGNGNLTVSGDIQTGRLRRAYRSISAAATLTSTDSIVAVSTGTSFTVTLPNATTFPVGTDLTIKKTASANTLTVAAASGQNIDGATTSSVTGLGALRLVSNGSNGWHVV